LDSIGFGSRNLTAETDGSEPEMTADARRRLRIVPRGRSTRLGSLLSRVSRLARQKAELEETNRELTFKVQTLERLVYTDPLTGLGNRRRFDTVVAFELSRATQTGAPLTLLLCDVDHFKSCNDHHGHGAGDALLIQIGQVLTRFCRRGGDLAIRYAGDEFALLLPGVPRDTAHRFADQVRAAVKNLPPPWSRAAAGDCVTVSIGGAIFQSAQACSASWLVGQADQALLEAKRAGRDRARFAGA
jgi:diguanylate cyclase (GGDEF)-like protein